MFQTWRIQGESGYQESCQPYPAMGPSPKFQGLCYREPVTGVGYALTKSNPVGPLLISTDMSLFGSDADSKAGLIFYQVYHTLKSMNLLCSSWSEEMTCVGQIVSQKLWCSLFWIWQKLHFPAEYVASSSAPSHNVFLATTTGIWKSHTRRTTDVCGGWTDFCAQDWRQMRWSNFGAIERVLKAAHCIATAYTQTDAENVGFAAVA